jgi:hypothetical protein
MAYGAAAPDLPPVRDRDPGDRLPEAARYHGVGPLRLLRRRRQPDAPVCDFARFKADDRLRLQLRPAPNFGRADLVWDRGDDSSIASVVDDRLRFGDCVGDRENRVTNTIWRHRLGVDSDHARICGASELSLARAGGRGGVTGVRARVSGARIACERARLRVRRGLYQTQHGLHLLAGVAGRDCVSAPGGGVRRSTIGSGN